MIRATENVGGARRIVGKEYKTRTEAKRYLKKLLAPGKIRRISGGRRFRLTSFRNAQSGCGLKNPRIIKVKVFR